MMNLSKNNYLWIINSYNNTKLEESGFIQILCKTMFYLMLRPFHGLKSKTAYISKQLEYNSLKHLSVRQHTLGKDF
jgi:hypothetical protein